MREQNREAEIAPRGDQQSVRAKKPPARRKLRVPTAETNTPNANPGIRSMT